MEKYIGVQAKPAGKGSVGTTYAELRYNLR